MASQAAQAAYYAAMQKQQQPDTRQQAQLAGAQAPQTQYISYQPQQFHPQSKPQYQHQSIPQNQPAQHQLQYQPQQQQLYQLQELTMLPCFSVQKSENEVVVCDAATTLPTLMTSKSLAKHDHKHGKTTLQGFSRINGDADLDQSGPDVQTRTLSEASGQSRPSSVSSDRVHSKAKHFVRTGMDQALKPFEALQALILGNERYRSGQQASVMAHLEMRRALVNYGQAPLAAIVGCADSRCPVETLFDAMPGDLFVLRNAGNTCTHAEGSMVASLEYCIGNLGTKLILVLGHTSCGAIAGATKTYLAKKGCSEKTSVRATCLDGLLQDLGHVAEQSHQQLGDKAGLEEIAAHAVKVNVFHTISTLLKFSQPIRAKVDSGEVEIHGAVYDMESGHVDMLGPSPDQKQILVSDAKLPPSMSC